MLKITGLIWLEDIVEKLIIKHDVTTDEVREIIRGDSHFRFVEKGQRKDENVYAALGRTQGGRYLIVFFVYKKDTQALILSARNMTKSERKYYGRKK